MNIKVLVVDDSATMRRIVINSLKKIGYNNFVEAADGKAAWDIIQSQKDIDQQYEKSQNQSNNATPQNNNQNKRNDFNY